MMASRTMVPRSAACSGEASASVASAIGYKKVVRFTVMSVSGLRVARWFGCAERGAGIAAS